MGWTSHLTYRLMTMMRGELITIIFAKMLKLQLINASESAAMTLMGTDVQRIAETFHALLIDVVPSIVQLSIAVYLLYVQLGVVCIAPILVTISKLGILDTLNAALIFLLNSLNWPFYGTCWLCYNETEGLAVSELLRAKIFSKLWSRRGPCSRESEKCRFENNWHFLLVVFCCMQY